jgi:hypothetical protein
MADLAQLTMLKRDVEEWNEWRETHPTTRPFLFRGDLSNTSLREANLSRADLSEANLNLTDLTGADLEEANLTCILRRRTSPQRISAGRA